MTRRYTKRFERRFEAHDLITFFDSLDYGGGEDDSALP